MKTKVGLISTMSLYEKFPQEVVVKCEADHKSAKAALTELGFDVFCESDALARTKTQMTKQAEYMISNGVDVLVLYVGTWTYCNIGVQLAEMTKLPVLIWTDSGPGNIGLVGASITRGALDEIGVKNTLVHGGFDDKATLEKIKKWCSGAAAVMALRNKTLGVGGGRCMGMYTAHVDPSEIKSKFGIDIDTWEQSLALEYAKEVPQQNVDAFYGWMENKFGAITAKKEAVEAQIRLYYALKRIIRENEYDFVSFKCLPEMPEIYTSFCLAHAILNDMEDEDGAKEPVICACESDLNAALTMQILNNITHGSVLFSDYLVFEEETGIATLSNCGSQSTEFAKTKKDVEWVHEGLLEFEWKIGCSCPRYVARPGRVTIARLGRIAGEYVMTILTGETVEVDGTQMSAVNPQHPKLFVKMDASADAFIDSVRCNHAHIVFGDYVDELLTACYVGGIKPLLVK